MIIVRKYPHDRWLDMNGYIFQGFFSSEIASWMNLEGISCRAIFYVFELQNMLRKLTVFARSHVWNQHLLCETEWNLRCDHLGHPQALIPINSRSNILYSYEFYCYRKLLVRFNLWHTLHVHVFYLGSLWATASKVRSCCCHFMILSHILAVGNPEIELVIGKCQRWNDLFILGEVDRKNALGRTVEVYYIPTAQKSTRHKGYDFGNGLSWWFFNSVLVLRGIPSLRCLTGSELWSVNLVNNDTLPEPRGAEEGEGGWRY